MRHKWPCDQSYSSQNGYCQIHQVLGRSINNTLYDENCAIRIGLKHFSGTQEGPENYMNKWFRTPLSLLLWSLFHNLNLWTHGKKPRPDSQRVEWPAIKIYMCYEVVQMVWLVRTQKNKTKRSKKSDFRIGHVMT